MPTTNLYKKKQYNSGSNTPDFLRYNDGGFNTNPPVDQTPTPKVQNQVTPRATAPFETGKGYQAYDYSKNRYKPATTQYSSQNNPLQINNNPIKIPGRTPTPPAPTVKLGDSTAPIVGQSPTPTGDPFKDGTNLIQSQGQTRQDQILRDYNNATADIKLQEDQMKSKFTNSDEVLNGYKLVKEAYRAGTMDDNQIAQKTGLSLDFVKSVKNDTRHKNLQMSGQGEEEQDLTHQYQTEVQKAEKNKERLAFDFDTAKNQMQVKYDRQVEDIKNDIAKRMAGSKKMGALTGQANSSGYLYGIEDMKNRTYKNLDRMATQFGWDDDEINLKRKRMLEDFESNSKEMFYTYNKGMDMIRAKGIAGIQSIQEKYGIASEYTSKALETLYNDLEGQHLNVLNNTMKLQSSFNDLREKEIDASLSYQNNQLDMKYKQQQLDYNKQKAVQEMLKDPSIPPATKLSIQAQLFDQTFAQPVLQNLKKNGETGGQCAYYTNRVANLDQSQWMGNELASKTSKINSKTPVIGSVAVMDIGTRTGHVGIVTDIDPANGTITLNESNWNEDGKVGSRTIKVNDKTLKGFVVPNQIVNPYQEALKRAQLDEQVNSYNSQQTLLPESERNMADPEGNLQFMGTANFDESTPLATRMATSEQAVKEGIAKGLQLQIRKTENPNYKAPTPKTYPDKPTWMKAEEYEPLTTKYDVNTLKTASTIMKGSALKLTGMKQGEKREAVASALEDMAQIAYDRNDYEGILRASARFEAKLSDTTTKQIAKASTVINQLSNMQEVLNLKSKEDETLNPLVNWIAEKNPWDTDAQTLQALIQSTVPNLARGVYGEVGVLTDADVERYVKTIPNLRQTKDVQKAVQALTLKAVMNQVTDTLQTEAGNGVDVSNMVQYYEKIKKQVETMEKELGVGAPTKSLVQNYKF